MTLTTSHTVNVGLLFNLFRIGGSLSLVRPRMKLPQRCRYALGADHFETTTSELEKEKALAVASENYLEAARIKEELDSISSLTRCADDDGGVFRIFTERSTSIFAGSLSLPPLCETPCSLSGTSLRALVRPPDADALYQWYSHVGNSDADPSWAEVWPTAASLAAVLVQERVLVKDRDVVELGSGLAVAGIASSLVGARSVLLLDREPFALHCAMSTAALHDIPTAAFPADGASHGAVSAMVFDWCNEELASVADLLLASDVLYDDATVLHLASTAIRLLRPGGGRLLVTDPEKERTPGCREAFIRALEAAGATVTVSNLSPVPVAASSYSLDETPDRTVLIRAELN